jgi:hypothetical protein
MTEELRELLQQYGMVSVSLSHLASERPGNKFASLEEYYQSFGGLLPDEPAIVVRISKDGELRFLREGEHDVSFQDKEGQKVGVVTVWEMPEDEFWFFKAFRPGLFDLDKDLPRFLYEMGVTYCYALFESYLSEILRYRFRAHPLMLGSQREMKYGDILEAKSKEDLVDQMMNRQINDLFYLPIQAILQQMRKKYGFTKLTTEHDIQMEQLSRLRNCLMHNRGCVDSKLAAVDSDRKEGEQIALTLVDVSRAIKVLRTFAYEIDKVFENI